MLHKTISVSRTPISDLERESRIETARRSLWLQVRCQVLGGAAVASLLGARSGGGFVVIGHRIILEYITQRWRGSLEVVEV